MKLVVPTYLKLVILTYLKLVNLMLLMLVILCLKLVILAYLKLVILGSLALAAAEAPVIVTSSLTEAWKCNFSHFEKIMTIRRDQPFN